MNYKSKKVSVVMTAYNAEKYVGEAIESILNQTYKNIELIIIDDGSTDNTYMEISKYKDNGDFKIVSRENRGRAYSLNEAIGMASGEYIAIMDADDISYPTRIEKQVELLNHNREVYVVGTKIELIADKEEYLTKDRRLAEKNSNADFDRNDSFSAIVDSFKIMHSTWLCRREFYKVAGPYQETRSEDANILFKAICKGIKIDRVDEVLFQYRIDEASRSSVNDLLKDERIKFRIEYLIDNIDFENKTFKYLIWGSDYSGHSAQKIVQSMLPNGKLICYIDSFKEGVDEYGNLIIKPEKIKDLDYDYIFICTNGGGKYAREYLQDMGLKQVEEFFKIV